MTTNHRQGRSPRVPQPRWVRLSRFRRPRWVRSATFFRPPSSFLRPSLVGSFRAFFGPPSSFLRPSPVGSFGAFASVSASASQPESDNGPLTTDNGPLTTDKGDKGDNGPLTTDKGRAEFFVDRRSLNSVSSDRARARPLASSWRRKRSPAGLSSKARQSAARAAFARARSRWASAFSVNRWVARSIKSSKTSRRWRHRAA